MNQRQNWRFDHITSRLVAPAETKAEYHRQRQAHWSNELEIAREKFKNEGINWREHPVTGGIQVTPIIDPERQRHVTLCQEKVNTHHSQVELYESYIRAFKTNLSAVLQLDVEDITFFGL